MKHWLDVLSLTKREVWKLIAIFVVWRCLLLGIGLVADSILKYAPSFPYADTLLTSFSLPRFLYSWANFDGVHYLTIARQGYTQVNYIQAFFPLLPAIVLRPLVLLSQGQINILAVGLFLTQGFALGSIITWFALMKYVFGRSRAWISLLVFILFPSSLFLGALYSEGLFLSLVFLVFLLAAKKQWYFASLLVILASATRVIGIFLVPALLLEFYFDSTTNRHRWNTNTFIQFLKTKTLTIIVILSGSLGLIGYMLYLKIVVNDPLAFFHAQSAFGAGRQSSLVIYPQVVFRALKILLTSPFDLKYITYLQEFFAGTLGLVGVLLGRKYSRPGWILFALSAFFLPTLTGTFSSMVRYLLVCFPLYVFLAHELHHHSRLKIIWIALSGTLLIINTLLFLQGYWVA